MRLGWDTVRLLFRMEEIWISVNIFQRFSGLPFSSGDNEVARPTFRMQPVSADAKVEFNTSRNRLQQQVSVDSTLIFKADGTSLQYLPLRLPTQGSDMGSWVMESFQVQRKDDTWQDLAWVGLNADLTDTGSLRRSRVPASGS